MSDILYKFVSGKISLFIEDKGSPTWGSWYYFHSGVMYETKVEEYYTVRHKPDDREILRIYNSYNDTAQLELYKLISLIPPITEDQSFLNFKKDGDKYFQHNQKGLMKWAEGTRLSKKEMIEIFLSDWYPHVKEWKDRKKFLIKDSENDKIDL